MNRGFKKRAARGGGPGGSAGASEWRKAGRLRALGAGTAGIATVMAAISTAPAAQATPARGFEIAFQTSVGTLETRGPDGTTTARSDIPMAPGSSPSITASPGPTFGYEVGVRAQDGTLWFVDPITGRADTDHVAAGTSPSLALTSGGVVDTYFTEAPFGLMRQHGTTASAITAGIQLAPNSSPSGAWNASGMNKVAIVGTDGFLRQSENGSAFSTEAVNVFVSPGTSPAAAAGTLDAAIAVNNNGLLAVTRSSDRSVQGDCQAIRDGSSPAITALSNGGFKTAFVAPDGTLEVSDGLGCFEQSTGQHVAANSNPAIAADDSGGWEIAYTATDGTLATYDSNGVNVRTGSALQPGTSPSIARITPVVASPPPPPPTTTATLSMLEQTGGEVTFIPYVGKYPDFGSVPPFHLIGLQFPASGAIDQELYFIKPGHGTEQCGDPNAVVPLVEGQSLTPAQMTTLFGSTQPHYTTLSPLTAVACWGGNGSFPHVVELSITIKND